MEIPNDSILDNRYKIVKTLGRGGFGRAYLAQDSRRYNEQCVLKEFAPEIEKQSWNKAKELFDRECSQLYQLQHDQIPAFRELLKTKFKNKLCVFLWQRFQRFVHAEKWRVGISTTCKYLRWFEQDIDKNAGTSTDRPI